MRGTNMGMNGVTPDFSIERKKPQWGGRGERVIDSGQLSRGGAPRMGGWGRRLLGE